MRKGEGRGNREVPLACGKEDGYCGRYKAGKVNI